MAQRNIIRMKIFRGYKKNEKEGHGERERERGKETRMKMSTGWKYTVAHTMEEILKLVGELK